MIKLNYGDTFNGLYAFAKDPDPDYENALSNLVRYIITRHCLKGYNESKKRFLFSYKNDITAAEIEQYYNEIISDVRLNAAADIEKSVLIKKESFFAIDYIKRRLRHGGLLNVIDSGDTLPIKTNLSQYRLSALCISVASLSYNTDKNEIIFDFTKETITHNEMVDIIEIYQTELRKEDQVFVKNLEKERIGKLIGNIIGGNRIFEISHEVING